jgi:hypothetical protein
LYVSGQGVPENKVQAAFWYRKAAEQGEADAQYKLGLMYDLGRGVPRDIVEAYFWYALAAEGQQMDAAKYRDDAASHLKPADLTRAQERVRRWFEDHPPKP